ncbi:hypothetical protein FOZ62_010950 [Perkinsus olseni]|uniref:Mei2-like C-terminal RNA recognition motif domain-containing protein n=1 Tax=Perkinsus olseni TaxID=32597 RepID=A0A7J6PTX2_PEROL|nr:hypothetical protein FOZ62_010950 [Perkinsus olseni]
MWYSWPGALTQGEHIRQGKLVASQGLSSPASAVAICSYFETFGDIEAVDLSAMFNSESSSLSAVYITTAVAYAVRTFVRRYFDSRAPFLATNHLKGASSYAPRVVEVDPLGTGKPETIDISNVSLRASPLSGKSRGEVHIASLRWKVGETLSCCEKFGDIELINGHSPSSSATSACAFDLDSVATTVTFYDGRAADNFLRVLQSVKDMRRASCSLGEEKPSIESAERRATVPVPTSGVVKKPSELQSPTTESFTVQQRLADLFHQYDSSTYAPASDSDLAEYSGTPRDANKVTPANAAETLAFIIGSHHQQAAGGSSNSAATKEGGKLEISLAEKAALMCDTVREWGKPFGPSQPPQTTVGEEAQQSEDGDVEEMQDVQCYCMASSPRPTSTSADRQQQQQQRPSITSEISERGGGTENPGPIPHRTGGGSEEASMEDPSLVFPPYLALGIGRPVPLGILAMYFESFGEADFLDCTRMLTESSDPYAIRLSFFDRRVTEQVYQRLRGASGENPRCAAISHTGPASQLAAESGGGAPMEIIAITSCIMVDARSSRLRGAADPRVVDVEQLCWSLPEAVDCCSEFGALASANSRPVSRLVMHASELCREVEFHDSRAAEAFRNAVKVLEGGGGGEGGGGRGAAGSPSFPVSREEAPQQPPSTPPLRIAVAAGPAAVQAEQQQQQQQPPPTTPLPIIPTEPLISARTEPGGGGGGGGDGLLTTTAGVFQQQQPPSPRPTTTTPWGERSATTPPAPRYLTSQVARSLARFYRAVGVSDYRGAASSTAIQAAAPSPRAGAAATSPVVSVPGMEESLHVTEVEGGLANRTTVMVRNIPPAYTSSRLLQEILETLLEQAGEDELAAVNAAVGAPFGIDFVYLPFNLKNRAGVSYGFVNLTTPEELLIFHERFSQHVWRSGTSRAHNGGERRPCEMSAARLQGQQALTEAFVNRLHAKSEHIPLQARPLIYDPRGMAHYQRHRSSSLFFVVASQALTGFDALAVARSWPPGVLAPDLLNAQAAQMAAVSGSPSETSSRAPSEPVRSSEQQPQPLQRSEPPLQQLQESNLPLQQDPSLPLQWDPSQQHPQQRQQQQPQQQQLQDPPVKETQQPSQQQLEPFLQQPYPPQPQQQWLPQRQQLQQGGGQAGERYPTTGGMGPPPAVAPSGPPQQLQQQPIPTAPSPQQPAQLQPLLSAQTLANPAIFSNVAPQRSEAKDTPKPAAENDTRGDNEKAKLAGAGRGTFSWWSWLLIAILVALVLGGLLYYTDYMYHKQHYGGMPNKVLGLVLSAALRTKLDRSYYVTVQCGKDEETVLETAARGSSGTIHWNAPFRYSLRPEKARDFPLRKSVVKVTLYQSSDDGAKSLGSGEVSCNNLKDVRMTGGAMETFNVNISRFGMVTVKAGLGFSGWSEQKLDRLRASWRKKRSEVSFWTRLLLAPAEAVLLILKGVEGITHLHNVILSTYDLFCATTIAMLTLPFLLNYVGLSMFDKLKYKELRWTWATYSSLSGTGVLLWRVLGTFPAFSHLALYGGLGLLALLFMLADFRGESGSGVVSRAVGKVVGWHFLQRAPPPPDDGSFDPRSGLPVVTASERSSRKSQPSFVTTNEDSNPRDDRFPHPPSEIFNSPNLKEKQEDVDADAGRLDDESTEFANDSRGVAWALRHSEMDNDRKQMNSIINRRMYSDPKRAAEGPSWE